MSKKKAAAMAYELTPLDRHFADFIVREGGGKGKTAKTVVALLSHLVGKGHICLNLTAVAGSEVMIDNNRIRLPEGKELQDVLTAIPAVGVPGEFRPLILAAGERLYLYRYWKYERDLVEVILKKTALPEPKHEEALLADDLRRLFPSPAGKSSAGQKIAALAALRKRFLVVSGGPGTGKTATVIRIMALLLSREGPLRMALAAPTGKAAMRLRETVLAMKSTLACEDVIKAQIPHDTTTIHRLLGATRDATRVRYNQGHPLPHEVVIIDEASMVALPLMAKLAVAVKPDSRLILMGDKNQLASVEAGAVLGDICGEGRAEIFSPTFSALCERLTGGKIAVAASGRDKYPLCDSLVFLKENYRFPADGGIGAAASAVNDGNGREAVAIFKDKAYPEIAWHETPPPERLRKSIAAEVIAGYGPYLRAGTPEEALRLFDTFRFLCAMNEGPYGVAGLNGAIERILAAADLIDLQKRWYQGRPVMITVNDYNMELFNGDVGITFPDLTGDGKIRVFFPSPAGGIRKVSPLRLPAHETVYAMTIHKSQGSEYDRIHMIFPDNDSEFVTRELIYTGITRAKEKVDIWGTEEALVKAIAKKTERSSGLRAALWP